MSISAPFIARPVATALLAIAVLLAGILGYRALPISSLPQVDFPTIQVTTRLPGANAETMTALVTAPLERQLGQIPSLQSMTSVSAFGWSFVTLQFALERNIDAAGQDVQSAINSAGADLPQSLPYPPTYAKVNPADTPIMTLALTSPSVPIERLADLADTVLAQRLSQVSGVGHVTVQGNLRPAVRIQADLPRLAGYGLSLEDVRTAIAAANVAGSKGSLDGANKAFTLGANDQLEDAASYGDVVIAYVEGAPVRVKDIATTASGIEDQAVAARFNGQPAVILDVQRQPGTNIVTTVEGVRAQIPALARLLPAGATLEVVADRTQTIRASVSEVQLTLVVAVGLVVFVVLLFLRTLSATLVAAITLPLSLVATFAVMAWAGFSLDNLSLMALTVATGFVVDDAIVMIENIVRYRERGLGPIDAAREGAGEIGFTIISLTLSLVAVFIPLLFMGGVVGRLFREFSLTLTIAVVVSGIISLTLTPMLCARLLSVPREEQMGPLGRATEWLFHHLLRFYRRTLDWTLAHRRLTLLSAFVTLGATIALYVMIPKGFLPQQDTGFLSIITTAAQDVSFTRMAETQGRAEAIVRADPDVATLVSVLGVGATNPTLNRGHLSVTLRPLDERQGIAEVTRRLQAQLAAVPGLTVSFEPVQDIQIEARASQSPYQYVLTNTDAGDLARWAERLTDALRARPELTHVVSDLQENGPRVHVEVDRAAAGRLGVTLEAVNNILYDAFGQRQISTIYGQANQYRVVLEAAPRFQTDPAALQSLYVPGTDGAQVPLASFATISLGTAALAVSHADQLPAVTIGFDLAPGRSLQEAVAAIEATRAQLGVPQEVRSSFVGEALEFTRSLAGQVWLILAAIIVIYIVLGVLYESLIHPFTILTTLPSAGVGALLALMLCDMELTLVGVIGIVLLMGIVKKNAILMIDFALEAERQRGMSPPEAIREACLLRFRPITMTTLAALLGALPLALGHGAGSELRVPLGVTIIGGLMLSQLLTLYTTPVIYLAMDGLKRRLTGRGSADTELTPPPRSSVERLTRPPLEPVS